MIIRTSMAHICAPGTTGRLKSWHIYVPLAVDGLNEKKYADFLDLKCDQILNILSIYHVYPFVCLSITIFNNKNKITLVSEYYHFWLTGFLIYS